MFEELGLVLDSVERLSVDAMIAWNGSLGHRARLELEIMSSKGQNSADMEIELVSIVVRMDNGFLRVQMVMKQVWNLSLEMLTLSLEPQRSSN